MARQLSSRTQTPAAPICSRTRDLISRRTVTPHPPTAASSTGSAQGQGIGFSSSQSPGTARAPALGRTEGLCLNRFRSAEYQVVKKQGTPQQDLGPNLKANQAICFSFKK